MKRNRKNNRDYYLISIAYTFGALGEKEVKETLESIIDPKLRIKMRQLVEYVKEILGSEEMSNE